MTALGRSYQFTPAKRRSEILVVVGTTTKWPALLCRKVSVIPGEAQFTTENRMTGSWLEAADHTGSPKWTVPLSQLCYKSYISFDGLLHCVVCLFC
jgi:hypothetical protein